MRIMIKKKNEINKREIKNKIIIKILNQLFIYYI